MASVCIFASLLITMVPVLAKIEIQFTKWPEPVTAPVGSTNAFECAVQVPAEKFVWRTFERMEDTKSWRNVPATDVNSTMSKLLVTVTEDMPNSWFQCVVSYGAMTLASVPARLTVARLDLSQNTQGKRMLIAPLHNDIALHCKPPLSDPPAVLTWWKEERGTKKHIASSHGVLVLQNVTLEDSGMYRCTATNELSGQVADLPEATYLQVQHKGLEVMPSFLESEEFVGVKKNEVLTKILNPDEPLRLWCGAVGNPQPKVRWSREKHHQQVIQLNSKANGQAFFVEPFKKEDEGIYVCSANSIRRAWMVSKYQEPMWDGAAEGKNASEGHPALISCGRPRAVPSPMVYWLLNSELLVPGRGLKMTDRELHIERVEKRHAGVVQCVACNARACAYDAALLTVEPAQISNPGYSDNFEQTENFLSQSAKRHSRKNLRKQVMVPPSRPNVTRMSDNSVMVTWSGPSGGIPISFYKVQYREIGNNSTNSWNTDNQDIAPNIHSCLIDGIEPDKYYRFRISAVYSNEDNKQGKTSAKFYLQRGGFHKPATPVLTSAVSYAPTEIMLNWTWSRGAGPKNEGFYVYYRVLSTAGQYDKMGAAPDARALIVTHLQPDVAYEMKIQAYTEQTPSDFSAILKAKTMRGTTLPPVVVTSPAPDVSRRSGALVPAAGAVGAALVLAAAVSALLLCRRARRPPLKEKNSRADSSAGNGYIPAKVPITITANPMHNEAGDSSVEMSYMHNNNCGNNTVDDNTPHNRKSTRNYV